LIRHAESIASFGQFKAALNALANKVIDDAAMFSNLQAVGMKPPLGSALISSFDFLFQKSETLLKLSL
jgi:hypothetical protein